MGERGLRRESRSSGLECHDGDASVERPSCGFGKAWNISQRLNVKTKAGNGRIVDKIIEIVLDA